MCIWCLLAHLEVVWGDLHFIFGRALFFGFAHDICGFREVSSRWRHVKYFYLVARFLPRWREEFDEFSIMQFSSRWRIVVEFGSICNSCLLDLEKIPNLTWFGRLLGQIPNLS